MKKFAMLSVLILLIATLFTACKPKVEYLSTDPGVQIGASKVDTTENENNTTSQSDTSSKKQNADSQKPSSSKITQSTIVSDWSQVEPDDDDETTTPDSSSKKPSSSSSSEKQSSEKPASSSGITVSQDNLGWSPWVPIG